ncbi:putative hmg box protein [Botrytis fragariae]|uniref:Putative hmg box protein n=1 Tax=Botrytis fragariae TaxID=1964551 RepID=A0A8H6AMZ7_9HELO|nr:putative hmg box protein [Botrytis fragariae]KAF5870447.1 putative hmg box protein [Botrytis fragariae]
MDFPDMDLSNFDLPNMDLPDMNPPDRELQLILNRLQMLCYLNRLVDAGFDNWKVVKDITEKDMQILGMKLGHIRKLQREIATSRGWPQSAPLNGPYVCCGGQKQEPVELKQEIMTQLTVSGTQYFVDANGIG